MTASSDGWLLAIESASERASVALLRGDEPAVLETAPSGRDHAESLLGLIDAALSSQGITLSDVGAFGLAIGPGSFTSLRIGLATVKGLAFGTGRPALPVSTLAALALSARRVGVSAAHVAPLLDARKGEVYGAVYGRDVHDPVVPEGVYTAEELAPRLPADCCAVGDGALRLSERLHALQPALAVGPADCLRADAVGILAARAWARGEGEPAEALVPRYLLRAQAEAERLGSRREGP